MLHQTHGLVSTNPSSYLSVTHAFRVKHDISLKNKSASTLLLFRPKHFSKNDSVPGSLSLIWSARSRTRGRSHQFASIFGARRQGHLDRSMMPWQVIATIIRESSQRRSSALCSRPGLSGTLIPLGCRTTEVRSAS